MEMRSQTEITEISAERKERLWTFFIFAAVIAATIVIATLAAHWLNPPHLTLSMYTAL